MYKLLPMHVILYPSYIGGVRMKYPSHCVLVMGESTEEGSSSSANTCHKAAVGQMLRDWPSPDLAESAG